MFRPYNNQKKSSLNIMLRITIFLATLCCLTFAAELDELFAWKELTFNWPNEQVKQDSLRKGSYIPENNLPLGIARWKDKLFVTVPRWKAGVAASLNYLPLNANNKTASLTPYPDWKANLLPEGESKPDQNNIISTFRIDIDPCDRLWVMDTGLADILGNPKQVAKPAILIYDLKTDTLLRRYEMKDTDSKEDSFFANIVVDVNPNNCNDAYAYVPDLGGYGIVVYSWADNDSWRIKHNFFHFDPLKGNLYSGGVNFQWTDGVFALALSPLQNDGFRTMYFHALASTKEFAVSTKFLRNQTLATDPANYYEFKLVGERGDDTQATASDLDEATGVLFLTQLNKDGVACWNTKKPLNSNTLGTVAHDKDRLIFTNDVKLDNERNLFILSDKMPVFIYKQLNPNEINYRIFKVKVDDAIKGTPCE